MQSLLCSRVPFRYVALTTASIIGISSLSGIAGAAGYALNETSASSAGTAYAGRAAAAQDSSALSSNPAAISSLTRPEWTIGGALIVPKGDISEFSAQQVPLKPPNQFSVNGRDGGKFVSPQFVPGVFYAVPMDDRVTFGFGIYAPFGTKTDYDNDFVGRYLALKTDVQNINIQPTVSWKLNEQVSLGIGVFASYITGEMTQSVSLAPNVNTKSTIKGNDIKPGIKLGGLWNNSVSSVGVSWSSQVDFTLRGTAKLDALPSDVDAHLKVRIPNMFEIGGSHQLNEQLTLVGGALWTRWSSFKEIKVVADGELINPLNPLNPITAGDTIRYVPEKWRDTWAYSIGARYQLDQQWLLRFGYAYDESPVKDEYRTARIPDIDRNWVTVGAHYQPSYSWGVDMAYGYLIPKTVKVKENAYNADKTVDTNSWYQGKYKMSAHIAMLSLTYQY